MIKYSFTLVHKLSVSDPENVIFLFTYILDDTIYNIHFYDSYRLFIPHWNFIPAHYFLNYGFFLILFKYFNTF